MMRLVSWGHQDRLSTPCVCPRHSVSGRSVDERRSKRRTTGFWSSLEAVMRCWPFSGFQHTSEIAFCPRMTHQGIFWRRSQMMLEPSEEPVHTMCDTCVFQATLLMGPEWRVGLGSGAGGSGVGDAGLSKGVIHTLPSAPPLASTWLDSAWGLNCTAVTEPACGCTVETWHCDSSLMSLEGSHTLTQPSVMPPATKPQGNASAWPAMADQLSDANRDPVFTLPSFAVP
mmetsp:Transcript_19616/g.59384  ORF Transcript_19616/g.59384 Transcript_19616/m.59384 type:complete len:228 (+) Transcript_19616:750-1433(+)